jgi:hypothetical protein
MQAKPDGAAMPAASWEATAESEDIKGSGNGLKVLQIQRMASARLSSNLQNFILIWKLARHCT